MTIPTTLGLVPYVKRPAPSDYNAAWLNTELGNVQRGIPSEAVRTVFKADTPTTLDSVVLCDATAGAFSVTLPKPGQVQGLVLTFVKIDSGSNAVTLVGTINGSTSNSLASQYKSVTVVSSGTAWFKIASQ